jgi:tRNA (uracil-5-)-methyltransferase TRM9
MNEATVRALAAINRDFYRDRAAEFSAKRTAPWPGWPRLAAALRDTPGTGAVRVLDVGCGHGRFARWVAAAIAPRPLALWGVDASEPLLETARREGPPGSHWRTGDVIADPDALPAGPFDLVALIALIHGVPSRERRLALLAECTTRVAPGGRLVVTIWRRGDRERGVDWNSYSSRADMPIDCTQLEPGDRLIPWGPGDDVVRYFHFFDESELSTWTAGLPLALDERYRADGHSGDQNEYFVFRAR